MKQAKFTLQLTSHILANSVERDGSPDEFQRDGQNHIVFQQAWFHSAFCKGIEYGKIRGLKAADIHMDLTFAAPTELFKRQYRKGQFRTHEAIFPGTDVTFEALVGDNVTESILESLLTLVGKYVGLSPYGYNLGYGKFSVVSVHVDTCD